MLGKWPTALASRTAKRLTTKLRSHSIWETNCKCLYYKWGGIPSQCPPVGTTAAICITKTRTTYEILPTSFIPLGPAELHLHLLLDPSSHRICVFVSRRFWL